MFALVSRSMLTRCWSLEHVPYYFYTGTYVNIYIYVYTHEGMLVYVHTHTHIQREYIHL